MDSDIAMAKKTPQPVTCPNATKCIHFCGSRCYFARGKCQKTCKIYTKRVQIRRKMSTKKHGFRYRKRKKYTPARDVPKCVHFCGSRFYSARQTCSKITQNQNGVQNRKIHACGSVRTAVAEYCNMPQSQRLCALLHFEVLAAKCT